MHGVTRIAVVVGLCAHGLAIVRDLHAHGVEVHALEQNRKLPGNWTRCAEVHFCSDINGQGLVDSLDGLGRRLGEDREKVLFLTNDRMVRVVADAGPSAMRDYRVSWMASRDQVRTLLGKDSIEGICSGRGLRYPRSWRVESLGQMERVVSVLEFPVMVKPVRPLSGFKAVVCESREKLRQLVAMFEGDLPFLIQEWIRGDDEALHFCALYLDRGAIRARFDGRKLRSLPRAMGQTTVAIPEKDDEVFDYTRRFFEGLEVSGPVSLEVKRDEEGLLWVIEPTVGRTDYWLDCCVANGVSLAWIEFLYAGRISEAIPRVVRRRVWVDAEREPKAYWELLLADKALAMRGLLPRFTYLDWRDPMPFVRAAGRLANRVIFRRGQGRA